MADLASKRVAGLVLKANSLSDGSIISAAEEKGLAVLSVPAGASWSQIVQLAQSVLSHATLAEDELAGPLGSDLFGLADAIAELIDAPVTIEDRGSRVLAYSGRQDEADAARAETIVGRRVPERFVSRLEERGAFRKLREGSGCVYVDGIDDGVLPRLAVAVRAGDEMLGSIWAAVPARPDPDKEQAFAETAKVAALYLLRHRAGADVERTLQADLLAGILQGSAGAREASVRLGLAGPVYRVLALWLQDQGDGEAGQQRTQLRDVLAVHLSTFRVRGAAAVMGGIVFAVISCEADEEKSRELTMRLSEDVLSRGSPGLLIGIGGLADGLGDVPRSKRESEETLRALGTGSGRSVATIDQVRLPALLARFAEGASKDRDIYQDKIEPLLESDSSSGTAYVEALRAYFDSFGDYTAAASGLHIHPNTLRYRLRRAQEIAGVELDDPEERLALMLLLRLIPDDASRIRRRKQATFSFLTTESRREGRNGYLEPFDHWGTNAPHGYARASIAATFATALVAAAVVQIAAPAPLTSAFAQGDGHRHSHGLEMPGTDFGAALISDAKPDPSGQTGSGGRADVHRAGARPIDDPALVRRAPEARLHRTGVPTFEPTMGITSNGTVFANSVGDLNEPSIIRSTDGGRTWKTVFANHRISLDPYMYVDPDTDRVFANDLSPQPNCHLISVSDDNGKSWATSPPAGCGWNADHQTVFAGPPPEGGSETSDYPNIVYICSIGAGVSVASAGSVCSKSLDGGTTFLPTGEAAFLDDPRQAGDYGVPGLCNGANGHGWVGEDGTVFLPRGWCGQPWLAMSTDEGQSWTRAQVSNLGMPCCGVLNGQRSELFTHEAGVVSDEDGNIYYTWVAADRLPYLVISRDGGETWGKPLMIGPPGLEEALLPGITIGDRRQDRSALHGYRELGVGWRRDQGQLRENDLERVPDHDRRCAES